MPTDDPKLKAIIIPVSCLTQQSQSQTFFEQVIATLASLQVCDTEGENQTNALKTELFLPAFDLQVENNVPELEGLRLSETKRIKGAKIQCQIHVTNAKAQEEGLILDDINRDKTLVVESSFVFVLTDAELEEKVDNMPLFVAKVLP